MSKRVLLLMLGFVLASANLVSCTEDEETNNIERITLDGTMKAEDCCGHGNQGDDPPEGDD